jgi:Na+-transporting NADH:ubiquinone oxidoreductase subunit NqrB
VSSRSLTNYAGQSAGHGPSVPELLGKLATESSHLIRDEIALAKQEMSEKVVVLRSGLIWAVFSASLGLTALLALCGAAAAALASVIGAWRALLLIGGGLALISAVLASVSARILKRMPLMPEETLDTLEESKQWLKEMT